MYCLQPVKPLRLLKFKRQVTVKVHAVISFSDYVLIVPMLTYYFIHKKVARGLRYIVFLVLIYDRNRLQNAHIFLVCSLNRVFYDCICQCYYYISTIATSFPFL